MCQGFAKPLLNGLVSVSPVGASCAISLQHIQLLLRRPAATAIVSWYATVWASEAEVKRTAKSLVSKDRFREATQADKDGRFFVASRGCKDEGGWACSPTHAPSPLGCCYLRRRRVCKSGEWSCHKKRVNRGPYHAC